MTLDELFVRRPWRWGLRGDPHVWAAMREVLRGQAIPDNGFDARRIFEAAFAKVVGTAPAWTPGDKDALFVEQFRTSSGMSDGHVSMHFWACR